MVGGTIGTGEMPTPSTTLPTEAVLSRACSQLNLTEVLAIKVAGQPAKPQWLPLVGFKDMPDHRATNKYLLKGYRAQDDVSLRTALFRGHSETVNIWSHLAGSLLLLPCLFGDYYEHTPWLSTVLRVHAAIGVCCGFASVVFHISESFPLDVYNRCIQLDYAFAFLATVSHSALLAAVFFRETPHVAAPLLALLLLISVLGVRLFVAQTDADANNTQRHADRGSTMRVAGIMLVPVLLAVPICTHVLLFDPDFGPVVLSWVLSFAVAALVWLFKLPERLFPPGTFDYVGNSHNVMHVMVLVTFLYLHNGSRALLAKEKRLLEAEIIEVKYGNHCF